MPPACQLSQAASKSAPKAKAVSQRVQRKRKADKRQQQLVASKDRMLERRKALTELNAVVQELKHENLRVQVKQPDKKSLGTLFRFLARRELEGNLALQCREAVKKFVDHGGKLPEGVSLSQVGPGLSIPLSDAAAIPRHKVLQASFNLRSRAFMVTYNSTTFTEATWGDFKKWAKTFAGRHGARAWAACLEESLNAEDTVSGQKRYHLHAYFIWVDDEGLKLESLDALYFQNVRPRVDVCTGAGSKAHAGAPRKAALHGLWYVTVHKLGTISSATNYVPWKQYSPSMAWLTSLWDEKKLSHKQFLEFSADFRTGHATRKRDAEAVQRQELEAAISDHVNAELSLLETSDPLEKFRVFAMVDDYISSFAGPKRRRPILLLVGGTNTGKSQLAAYILQRIASMLQLQHFLEITVESDEVLDFSEYDHRYHAGVLLDGIGDVLTLWRQREVLQARPKKCRGGRSATMVYSYPFTLARRAVVATMDLTAKNLHLLQTNHWLKDARNVCCLRLEEPAWVQRVPSVRPGALTGKGALVALTVDEVAALFESRDAAGLGRVLQQNAVNGLDLLGFSCWEEIHRDLQVSPFAAKKILRIRDQA